VAEVDGLSRRDLDRIFELFAAVTIRKSIEDLARDNLAWCLVYHAVVNDEGLSRAQF